LCSSPATPAKEGAGSPSQSSPPGPAAAGDDGDFKLSDFEVPPMPAPLGSGPDRYAVMALGGTQYKVSTDDIITVEKLRGFNVGEIFRNESVLLVGSRSATIIGQPLVTGAYVEAVVEEQALANKIIIFKKKRRKGYQRWKGFRAELTVVRIGAIRLPPDLEDQMAPRGGA